jgi:hypothetical protein
VDDIKQALLQDVIKREVVEGDKANEARKQLNKAASKSLRSKKAAAGAAELDEPDDASIVVPRQSDDPPAGDSSPP